MYWLSALSIGIACVWALACLSAPLWLWTVAAAVVLAVLTSSGFPSPAFWFAWTLFGGLALALNAPPIRRALLMRPLLSIFRKSLPSISSTEREALEAGSVWWEGELFRGRPDWEKLLAYPRPTLSAAEQEFLDGPVETLCGMLDEWQITHERLDLPPPVWHFIKEQGFLGLIIPREYGGKEFSAVGHAAVVLKLASRSSTAAVSVMVPNSLGPAELLLRYGTAAQKARYLPRLAHGLEMPCFALTGPDAGSDAASTPDTGVVCRREIDGREVLGIRLNWDKRYITLAPVATLIGLAFRLEDPDGLLGERKDLGITLALVPRDTPGVEIGRRHFPLNAVFQNGPIRGRDVFAPMDWVIGGRDGIGQGWRMLMDCLAAGRALSLPAGATAAAMLACRVTGAYARVRVQFNSAIGRFEGVEEALARMAGSTYLMEAARIMTAGAVDLGEQPAIASGIVKLHLTERARRVVNDAMDIHGGKAICLGPRNYLGRAYQQLPIAITVEGSNILTRSMIIFGQGALRCHPFLQAEIAAARGTGDAALEAFDDALRGHLAYTLANAARAPWLALTGAGLLALPGAPGLHRHYRQCARLSASLALIADAALWILGGSLKRREKLSARLGDALSELYLACAVLKRFEDDGRPDDDLPAARWALEDCLYRAERALVAFLANFPVRPVAWLLGRLAFPLGARLSAPSDRLGAAAAQLLLTPSASRDRLTRGIHLPASERDPVGELELALAAAIAAEPAQARLRAAVKLGHVRARVPEEQVREALAEGDIGDLDAELLRRAQELRRRVVAVDDFAADLTGPSGAARGSAEVPAGPPGNQRVLES